MLNRWIVLAYYCVYCGGEESDNKFITLLKHFSTDIKKETREAIECLYLVKAMVSGKTIMNIQDIIKNGLPDFNLPQPKKIEEPKKKNADEWKELIKQLKKELIQAEKDYENAEWNGGQLHAENCERRIKELKERLRLYKAELHQTKG